MESNHFVVTSKRKKSYITKGEYFLKLFISTIFRKNHINLYVSIFWVPHIHHVTFLNTGINAFAHLKQQKKYLTKIIIQCAVRLDVLKLKSSFNKKVLR